MVYSPKPGLCYQLFLSKMREVSKGEIQKEVIEKGKEKIKMVLSEGSYRQ